MGRSLTRRALLAFAAAALSFSPLPATAQNQPVVVYAAASLKNALDEIAADWTKQSGVEVRVSFAASSALAKQIENGAPADVFISADIAWMDYLAKKDLIRTDTRQNLLGNSLVLIANRDNKFGDVKIGPDFDLAKLLGKERLAVAAVETVPAGKYAKAALTKLGIWKTVEKKLAEAENVRAALAYVARGETPLGIVYRTDAAAEKNVVVISTFPAGSHPAIVYPAAQLKSSKNGKADDFQKALNTPEARAIFAKHGFTTLLPPAGS